MKSTSKEIIATLTNAAYGTAGLYILAVGHGILNALVGISAVFLWIGSSIYHGAREGTPVRRLGQSLDEVAMYSVLLALLAMAAVNGGVALSWILGSGTLLFTALVYLHLYPEVEAWWLVPLGATAVAGCVMAQVSFGAGCSLLLMFAGAGGIKIISDRVEGRFPILGDLLHGIWHLGTAAPLYLAWTYLR